MPDLFIFLLGVCVTALVLVALTLIGKLEEMDPMTDELGRPAHADTATRTSEPVQGPRVTRSAGSARDRAHR